MTRLFPMLFSCAALAAFAGGCGDDEKSTGDATPAPAETSQGSAAPAGGGVTIHMKDIAFDPVDATAKVGQKVTWVNDDDVDHNVVAEKGEDFKSELFGKDGTFDYTVDKPGKIEYVCTVHPAMKATLTVTG